MMITYTFPPYHVTMLPCIQSYMACTCPPCAICIHISTNIGYHGCIQAGVAPGSTVYIAGAGPGTV